MKLFIIGNGFDQGHRLPTSYWSFREFLKVKYPEFLYDFESHYEIYPGYDDDAKKAMLWNDLETNLANIDTIEIIENAVQMDMGLESGDFGIKDTLDQYFEEEYKYIERLAVYLKEWVATIDLKDVQHKTSFNLSFENALYLTFNYTAVLEEVYGIDDINIVHIHGSLNNGPFSDDPILGHGNITRMEEIQEQAGEAEERFDEKLLSICGAIQRYYEETYKNIKDYMYKLNRLRGKCIDEIISIGHSIAGVDLPYFSSIDELSQEQAKWIVYYYWEDEKQAMYNSLLECGIDPDRIEMRQSDEFYDL